MPADRADAAVPGGPPAASAAAGSAACRRQDPLRWAWEQAAQGRQTCAIAAELGLGEAKLRGLLRAAGLPLASARAAWRAAGTAMPEPAAIPGASGKRRRAPVLLPDAIVAEAVAAALKGEDVSAVAREHGALPVSVIVAVRRRLSRQPGLTPQVIKREKREAALAEVRALMRHGLSMRRACRDLGLPYPAIHKSFQRADLVARATRIRDALLAAGVAEALITALGAEHRRSRSVVATNAGGPLAWLDQAIGPAFRSACQDAGLSPEGEAASFARWIAGRY